jgi:hypothetical protein
MVAGIVAPEKFKWWQARLQLEAPIETVLAIYSLSARIAINRQESKRVFLVKLQVVWVTFEVRSLYP